MREKRDARASGGTSWSNQTPSRNRPRDNETSSITDITPDSISMKFVSLRRWWRKRKRFTASRYASIPRNPSFRYTQWVVQHHKPPCTAVSHNINLEPNWNILWLPCINLNINFLTSLAAKGSSIKIIPVSPIWSYSSRFSGSDSTC